MVFPVIEYDKNNSGYLIFDNFDFEKNTLIKI
jgi:hypothetical protein